jgi:hypothetical protein
MQTQPTTTNTAVHTPAHDRGDQPRPYRARGEGRGNYRGRQDRPEGEVSSYRGRGRGGYNNQTPGETTDGAYVKRPYVKREDGAPYVPRGNYVPRGDRGTYRGRGGQGRTWEEARPVREEELGSDEEIVAVSEQQMQFIKEWQAYGRKNVRVLSDEKIVRVCIDFDFDQKKI